MFGISRKEHLSLIKKIFFLTEQFRNGALDSRHLSKEYCKNKNAPVFDISRTISAYLIRKRTDNDGLTNISLRMPYFQYRTSFHLQETVIQITSVISDIYLDGIEEQNSSVCGRSQDGGAGRGPSQGGDRSITRHWRQQIVMK